MIRDPKQVETEYKCFKGYHFKDDWSPLSTSAGTHNYQYVDCPLVAHPDVSLKPGDHKVKGSIKCPSCGKILETITRQQTILDLCRDQLDDTSSSFHHSRLAVKKLEELGREYPLTEVMAIGGLISLPAALLSGFFLIGFFPSFLGDNRSNSDFLIGYASAVALSFLTFFLLFYVGFLSFRKIQNTLETRKLKKCPRVIVRFIQDSEFGFFDCSTSDLRNAVPIVTEFIFVDSEKTHGFVLGNASIEKFSCNFESTYNIERVPQVTLCPRVM